ncbi:protein translation Initiation Factor 2 (IF-2) [Burkholderia pseudomallei]|nr:protein translation Initiation Factor 2 (IF-2) [Burkholderia pseudomallei]
MRAAPRNGSRFFICKVKFEPADGGHAVADTIKINNPAHWVRRRACDPSHPAKNGNSYMASSTVEQFAIDLDIPPQALLAQLRSAGIVKGSLKDYVTDADKQQLRDHLIATRTSSGAVSSSKLTRVREEKNLWHEALEEGRDWTSLLRDFIACECGGIRTVSADCPACGSEPYSLAPMVFTDPSGTEHRVSVAFAGAEGRREDYQLLALMEREWHRPRIEPEQQSWLTSGMSERASVVLLFWTYFESRMNRLVKLGLRSLPETVQKDLLGRYDSVTSHMRQLYQILFGVKYLDDLIAVGAESIGGHLARVQDARNRFVHGDPEAISDALVDEVVRNLKAEHDAWIAVFNRRVSIMRLPVVP